MFVVVNKQFHKCGTKIAIRIIEIILDIHGKVEIVHFLGRLATLEPKIQELQEQTEEVCDIIANAVNGVLYRDQKLQDMIERAETLQGECKVFRKVRKETVLEMEKKRRERPSVKKLKRTLAAGLLCCVLAIPVVIVVIAGPAMALINSFASGRGS